MNRDNSTLPLRLPPDPSPIKKSVKALRVRQPIGDIYLAKMDHAFVQKITFFDVRRVLRDTRDLEAYLGIQRPLNERRVAELEKYVNFVDATFPTSIILAVDDADFVTYDEKKCDLTFSNVRPGDDRPDISFASLCRVIDGQHRIAGLKGFSGTDFEVMVAVFVGIDISDQAYIFATVNLEQTKVNKSLAFDLFDLAKTRSPHKTCHNVAVALDEVKNSPLQHRIKRLGAATDGREFETITQATFVESLVRYISRDPKTDRDILLRGEELERANSDMLRELCFRNLFIDQKDIVIARIVQAYFDAVRSRWPKAWDDFSSGMMLNKTNGFRALMSVLGRAYTHVAKPGDAVDARRFSELFRRVSLKDSDFHIENFKPGTSGEAKLRTILLDAMF